MLSVSPYHANEWFIWTNDPHLLGKLLAVMILISDRDHDDDTASVTGFEHTLEIAVVSPQT